MSRRGLKVLIADDHPVVRRGLKQILSESSAIAEVGEAADPQQVLDLARSRDWDVIVLDLALPGRGGLDVLKELKQDRPKRPVLILSMHAENQYAVRALRAGASGYLTKETASDTLLAAIGKVARGGRYVTPSLAEQLAARLHVDDAQPLHATLSDREFQVLRFLASGRTVGEIAAILSLSVKTISTYRARILEKTGLRNNAELMKYALEQGLLDDSSTPAE
jgi:two-component system, NarL family, invasion response regulator UvrY